MAISLEQWVFQRRNRRRTMGEYGEVDPYEPTLLNRVWHQDARVNWGCAGASLCKRSCQGIVELRLFSFGGFVTEVVGNRPAPRPNRLQRRVASRLHRMDKVRSRECWCVRISAGADARDSARVGRHHRHPSQDRGARICDVVSRAIVGIFPLWTSAMARCSPWASLRSCSARNGQPCLCIEEPETGCIRPASLALRSFMELAYPPEGQAARPSPTLDAFAVSRGLLRQHAGVCAGVWSVGRPYAGFPPHNAAKRRLHLSPEAGRADRPSLGNGMYERL